MRSVRLGKLSRNRREAGMTIEQSSWIFLFAVVSAIYLVLRFVLRGKK